MAIASSRRRPSPKIPSPETRSPASLPSGPHGLLKPSRNSSSYSASPNEQAGVGSPTMARDEGRAAMSVSIRPLRPSQPPTGAGTLVFVLDFARPLDDD